jgi:hypothetical protein
MQMRCVFFAGVLAVSASSAMAGGLQDEVIAAPVTPAAAPPQGSMGSLGSNSGVLAGLGALLIVGALSSSGGS